MLMQVQQMQTSRVPSHPEPGGSLEGAQERVPPKGVRMQNHVSITDLLTKKIPMGNRKHV